MTTRLGKRDGLVVVICEEGRKVLLLCNVVSFCFVRRKYFGSKLNCLFVYWRDMLEMFVCGCMCWNSYVKQSEKYLRKF